MKIKGLFENQQGYLMIRFDKKVMPFHRFLWEQYYETKIPSGMEVHHRDGNIKHNTIRNLELLTKKENLKNRRFRTWR